MPWFCVVHELVASCISQITMVINYHPEKSLLIVTFAKLSPHEINSICQFVIDLFTNSRMLSDTPTCLRFSIIQDWGTIHVIPDVYSYSHRVSSYQLVIDLWSFYFFSYILFVRLVADYSHQENCKYFQQ